MFTGIITDVGTVRSAEQRGDLRLTHRLRLRPRHRRPRRLDRLLGRLPDRGRQGRRLVRGRRSAGNRVAHRAGPVARRRAAQPRARAAPRRRARRPYRHRPCRRASARSSASAPKAARPASAFARPPTLGADHRRQGLDHARRRVADRQRGRATPTDGTAFLGQHHPPHRRADHARRASPPGDSSMSRSTCSPAISTG